MMPTLKKCRLGASAVAMLFLCMALLTGCNDKTAAEYIQDAQKHRAAGNISAGIIDLKNALQQEPKNLTARILLARFYLDLPDSASAESELLHARQDGADAISTAVPLAQAELLLGKPELALKETDVGNAPSPEANASLMAARGQALMALGRMSDASDALEAGLKSDPHSVDVLSAMVRYALVKNDLPTARDRLAEAEKQDPKNPTLFSLSGAIDFGAGDFAASEKAFQNMLKAAPWSLAARVGIARAQIAEGRPKDADPNLEIVLKAAPNDPNTHYLRALAAFREADYVTAQTHIQRALSTTKSFPQALLLGGAISYALRQFEQANTYLTQYVYLIPNNVQALKMLAAVQMASGRAADAVKTLSPSVAGGTEDAQLLAMIGAASARSGDLTSASRYLAKAVSKQPDNATLRTQLGVAEVALGQTDVGIEDLQKAGQQDPNALRPELALFSAYMRNKLYDKALEVGERVEKSHPTLALGFDLAGFAYVAKGDRDSARNAFLKGREAQPGDALTLRTLAAFEVKDGNLAAASQYLEESLKANPKNTQAYLDLAEIDGRENHPQEMVANLRKAIEQDPDNWTPRVLLGRVLLLSGKAQDALDTVQPALTKDPNNFAALEVAGRAQLALKHTDAALTTFKTLSDLQPQSSVVHRYLAEAHALANDIDAAILEARSATELDPKDEPSALMLVRLYMAKRDFEAARSQVDKMTADHPNDPSILAIDGDIALAQGRPDDAVASFKLALDISDNGLIRSRLAAAQVKAGHPDEAEKTLRSWIDAHADDMVARMALADIYLAEHRAEDAKKQYEIVLAKFPNNVIVENNLAWALSELGQTKEALEHARHAAALAPTAPDVLDTLAVVLLQDKNANEAVTTLDRAVASAPANPQIQYHLAQALAQSGDKARARSVLKSLLGNSQPFAERPQAEQLLTQLGS